jgi:hypothetical protein
MPEFPDTRAIGRNLAFPLYAKKRLGKSLTIPPARKNENNLDLIGRT